jgi:hypothetical protein
VSDTNVSFAILAVLIVGVAAAAAWSVKNGSTTVAGWLVALDFVIMLAIKIK